MNQQIMSQTKKTFLRLRFFLLLVTIFFCTASAYCGVSINTGEKNILADTATLENEYVVAYKNPSIFKIAKNATTGTKIIVALSKIKIKSSKGVLKLKRGEVSVFTENESYYAVKGNFFEIKIKNNHPKPALPEKWFEPKKNKIVFDNEDFRIFEERLGPKEDRELHSHLQRLVVRLNNTHLTDPRFYPNGQEGKGIQVPNTVKFAEPVEHVVRNLSDIPVFNIVIEFKGK
jgi:hypothetical protein